MLLNLDQEQGLLSRRRRALNELEPDKRGQTKLVFMETKTGGSLAEVENRVSKKVALVMPRILKSIYNT